MCRRNNMVHRRVTRVGQKVPGNAVEIAEDFLDEMRLLRNFANLANMDETPCHLTYLAHQLLTLMALAQ